MLWLWRRRNDGGRDVCSKLQKEDQVWESSVKLEKLEKGRRK
jgi:hypothetical protein